MALRMPLHVTNAGLYALLPVFAFEFRGGKQRAAQVTFPAEVWTVVSRRCVDRRLPSTGGKAGGGRWGAVWRGRGGGGGEGFSDSSSTVVTGRLLPQL